MRVNALPPVYVRACVGACVVTQIVLDKDDEVERLTTLLGEEGDGRVSYRSLLGLLTRHLGNWTKRLPEVLRRDI